jgi:thiol-disulfide isomerase/thioredoxin
MSRAGFARHASRATRSGTLSIVLAGTLFSCGGESAAPAPPTSRFESVVSTQGDVDQVLHDVCDISKSADAAPSWEWPTMASGTPAALASGKWTWVNFWATWCHPCLEEMPLLRRSLASGPIDLRFVSADANDEQLAQFRREQSFTPASPRLADPGAVGAMLTRLGFRGASSLPVHVLLDPQGKVRCVRAGLVESRHVERILSALGQQVAPAIR